MRTCGECTLCCKLMAVAELGPKPVNVWCQHCSPGKGCKIYGSHPHSCKTFECLWRAVEDTPEDMRPDKTHVFITSNPDEKGGISSYTAFVDPGYPDAWQQGDMFSLIKFIVVQSGIPMVITQGYSTTKKVLVRLGPGIVGVRTMKMTEPDETGKQVVI